MGAFFRKALLLALVPAAGDRLVLFAHETELENGSLVLKCHITSSFSSLSKTELPRNSNAIPGKASIVLVLSVTIYGRELSREHSLKHDGTKGCKDGRGLRSQRNTHDKLCTAAYFCGRNCNWPVAREGTVCIAGYQYRTAKQAVDKQERLCRLYARRPYRGASARWRL
eukprot:SAG11_NODE_2117_length_3792_cov_2.955321_2_plen_169_part_00